LWEVERILNEIPQDALPNVLVMENVPQVHADANQIDFEHWLKFLRGRGYFNFYKDLNSKDYGIPQNRERCFCVSILSEEFIDFEFPEPIKLEQVMREYLEEGVDEKYYVNTEKTKNLITDLQKNGTLETLENAGGGRL
jgi:DNA (cytosine-5)-methyltransferase 1